MSAPSLEIQVEPLEAGKAVFLPLAASSSNGSIVIKLVLRLRLHNTGETSVNVTGIAFTFPDSSHAPISMQGVNMDGSLFLSPGQANHWSNGVVDLDPDPDIEKFANNTVFLAGPAPARVKIDVVCTGHADAASITLDLKACSASVPAGAWRFPYAAGELRTDEYYSAKGTHWANGGTKGTQIYAHDIGVLGWDAAKKAWSETLPGKDRSANDHYRIWGKPVRAVAAGTVHSFADGMDDNTVLGEFPEPTPSPVTGNFFALRHGDEVIKYCHLQAGSMPAALKVKGAAVAEGQMLGRVGNSGNSTNPHTHLECVRASDGALRPLPFRSAWVVDRTRLSPPGSEGPWVRMRGQGISKESVLVWPASTVPGFPIATVGISHGGDWANSFWISPDLESFQKTAQSQFDDKGLRLVRVTTYLEEGRRRWAGIARGGDWASQWWVSDDLATFQSKAQQLFDTKGLRLSHVAHFVEAGHRRWVGIARSGDWGSRLIVKDDLTSFSSAVQKLFDDDGYRPVLVTTWREGAKRRWLGLSQTGTWASRWWISADAGAFRTKVQQLFDHDDLRLAYVSTYVEGTQRRWIGIVRSGKDACRWYVRSDLDAFALEAQRLFDEDHLRITQLEMLD